jgi:hypothetical protein
MGLKPGYDGTGIGKPVKQMSSEELRTSIRKNWTNKMNRPGDGCSYHHL